MSANATVSHAVSTTADRLRICGSAALTYGVALWIITANPFVYSMLNRAPISWSHLPTALGLGLTLLLLVIGWTPIDFLVRAAVVALVFQAALAFLVDGPVIDMERYRPYVFWRALYRFVAACSPFLRGRRLDAPPSTSLSEYERVTVRYFFAKFLFMPLMISFFFANLQNVILAIQTPVGPAAFSGVYIQHLYSIFFRSIMLVDVAWFAVGCTFETDRFSPIKTVDPYASGWLVTLACYPPFVFLSGQWLQWSPPEFPIVSATSAALFFAIAGVVLYVIYFVADICFGLKCGNLLYRGLVDKGPYRLIRHPMYTTKTLAWCIFTIPAINFHLGSLPLWIGSWHISLPAVLANWGMIWPMAAWVTIYAMRGITEERYLLSYPEYRDYCKRVRHRFIPWLV